MKLEYFPASETPKDESLPENLYLPDTVYEPLPVSSPPLTILDEREACRALRGHVLRTEVYADDDDPALRGSPYVITEQSYAVRRIQSTEHALGTAKHGIFFAYPRETLTLHTERRMGDPRVGHEFVLEVGPYGDVQRKASVVYGRRTSTPYTEQTRAYATLSEAEFAHHDEVPTSPTTPATTTHNWYRASVGYEQRTYELTGMALPTGARLWTVDAFTTAIASLPEVPYESPATATTAARRLVERNQQRFYSGDLTTELPLGSIESPTLPYRSYQYALTPGIVTQLVNESQTLSGTAFNPSLLVSEGRYESRSDGYWVPSGVIQYDATQFYLPIRARDPFDNEYSVEYDDYALLMETTTDPLGNTVVAENDYRVLAPSSVTDPNLNRSAVAFDALGMVVRTAVMGKATGPNEGDTLEHPTTRLEYHLHNWELNSRPAYVKTSTREVHYYPAESDAVPWQESFTYSDGFGRVVMQKVQAEAGPVPGVTGDVADRWVGTGRTVFNNKGNPVKQYEPFFSATSDYEDEATVVEFGVTPIIHYDPLDRVIQTDLPNGTFSRVVFDAWSQRTWDPNDNVRGSDCTWYSDRGSPDPNGPMPSGAEARAAWLAAKHAETPSVTHLDSMGRAFLVQADNGPDPASPSDHLLYDTRTELDIEGNPVAIFDARQIRINPTSPLATIRQRFDVLDRRYRVESADAGIRLSVADVAGKPLRGWDNRGQTMRSSYDALQRPTHSYVARGGSESLVGRVIYGESLPAADALTANLRLKTYQVFDSAGVVTSVRFDAALGSFDFSVGFDFKGNPLAGARRLAKAYKTTQNWNAIASVDGTAALAAVVSQLESETYTTGATYDALSRVTSSTAPDGSVTTPGYNRASLLERVSVRQGATTSQIITNIDYNAKGQRILCAHGERTAGAASDPANTIQYEYDPLTFRLTRILSTRASSGRKLQDLSYTYDPVGNIVRINDDADWNVILQSAPVDGHGLYEYDALYRLTHAEGREHPGQQGTDVDPAVLGTSIPHANDASALARYGEDYVYDEVGNIESVHHGLLVANPLFPDWTRTYTYATNSNRLLSTTQPISGTPVTTTYGYDDTAGAGGAHGSMTSMGHLSLIEWDYADRMQHAVRVGGGGGEVYFAYDASGQRVRKVYEHGTSIVEERIYLGGYEIFRRTTAGTLEVDRRTLHVMDGERRVAMAETTLTDTIDGLSGTRWRFQLDNHLGSASLETNAQGDVISYEEYHPYGTSAFRLADSAAGVSAKRYRYTGKERDEETSLYYHGARYYAPWLGRWTAADPLGIAKPGEPDLDLYAYVRGRATTMADPQGTQEVTPSMGFASAEERARSTERAIGEAKATVEDNAGRLATTACAYTARTGQCSDYAAIREKAIVGQNVAAHKEKYRFIPGTEAERLAWRLSQKNPVVARLLEHYQLNSGATLRLTEADMIAMGTQVQIGWMPKKADGSRPENPELAKLLTEGRAKWKATGAQVDMDVKFAGLVTTSVPGGLGTMTAYFEGKLSIFDGENWGFEGTMQFYDTYNFDKGKKNRTEDAQERLEIARERLKGTPFAVVSDKIKVRQAGGDQEASWSGRGSDRKAIGGLTTVGKIGRTLAKLFN